MSRCKKLARARRHAFLAQQGRCYYCRQPTWLTDVAAFATAYRLTLRQASQLRCTAEHLVAREDGGTDAAENIVVACLTCNRGRHARHVKKDAECFRHHVRRGIEHGHWQPPEVLFKLLRMCKDGLARTRHWLDELDLVPGFWAHLRCDIS